MSTQPRAVVVEDNDDLRLLLETVLEHSGFDVRAVGDAASALVVIDEEAPDLVTIDLTLPDLDGLELTRLVRARCDAYIVIVTSRQSDADLLVGLEIGADDYLRKPFSVLELRARVAALMRRSRSLRDDAPASPAPLVHGDLRVDEDRRTVHVADDEVPLTPIEFELLATLMRRPGTVHPYAELLAAVWGEGWVGDEHLVQVHLGNLRRKLGPDATGGYLRTVRGIGYAFDPA